MPFPFQFFAAAHVWCRDADCINLWLVLGRDRSGRSVRSKERSFCPGRRDDSLRMSEHFQVGGFHPHAADPS